MPQAAVYISRFLILALGYLVAGKIALLLAIPPGFSTPIWPAAGLALALIVRWGYAYLPAVAMGSFVTNLMVAHQNGADLLSFSALMVAGGISLGALLQAGLGAYLVKSFLEFPDKLSRLSETLSFMFWGGAVSCMVNALIGPFVLLTFGFISMESYPLQSGIWWVGDFIGVILLAPVCLLISSDRTSHLRKAIVAFPMAFYTALTILVFFDAIHDQNEKRQLEFDSEVLELVSEFEKGVQADLGVLRATERFFVSSDVVTSDEFKLFTARFLEESNKIKALGWLPKVENQNRAGFENFIQAQGYSDYQIKRRDAPGSLIVSEEKNVYFPIAYVEPYEDNWEAHGLDVYGNDPLTGNTRLEALSRARDTGKPIATGRFAIVQSENQYGLVIYSPVYSSEQKRMTLEQRRESLRGYNSGVFVLPRIMSDLKDLASERGVAFTVHDVSESTPEFLYHSETDDHKEADKTFEKPAEALDAQVEIEVAGRQWLFEFVQVPSAVHAGQSWQLWLILVIGMALAACFGIFMLLLSSRVEGIEKAFETEKLINEDIESSTGSLVTYPAMAMIAVCVLSILLWDNFRNQETARLQEVTNKEMAKLKIEVAGSFKTSIVALQRMAERWEIRNGTPYAEWQSDAKNYVEDIAALTAVEWVDENYEVKWIEPVEGNENAIGLNVAYDEQRKAFLDKAANNRQIMLTPPLDLVQGYRAMIAYVPITIDDQFRGFIVGLYDLDELFQNVVPQAVRDQFNFKIMDENGVVFQSTGGDAIGASGIIASSEIRLYERTLRTDIWPKDISKMGNQLLLNRIMLLAGLILAMLAGFAVYAALLSQQRSRQLKKNTLALLEARSFNQLINETNPDLIFVKDEEFRIVEANARFMNVYPKHMHDKIIGYTTVEEYPDEEALEFLKHDREAFERGYSEVVETVHFPNGTLRTLLTKKIRFENSYGEPFILGVARDITSQEKEIRILNEIYSISLDEDLSLSDKINRILNRGLEYFELDMGIVSHIQGDEYKIVYIAGNDDIKPGQVLEFSGTYCFHAYMSTEVSAWNKVGESELGKHPCYQNFGLESYIGTTLFVDDRPYGMLNFTSADARAEPFSDKEKAFINVIAQWIGNEITRSKDIKEKEQMIEKLSDSNEELERFAYVCSHDMQEPMRMVKSFSEKIKTYLGEDLDNKAKTYLNFVIDGAERAQGLISDILTYSSLDRDTMKPEKVDIGKLLAVVKETQQVNLEERGGQITWGEDLPIVMGNKTQLYQLFQNLVNNGLKYQKPDASPHVHVSVQEKPKHWEFTIKDNGIGMEQRHLRKIFDVFQRLHLKEEYAGTGVGLSICKKVVERHGGQIKVTSEVGEGSAFIFTLQKSAEEIAK